MYVHLYDLIYLYILSSNDPFSAAPARLARLKAANFLLPLCHPSDTRHAISSTITFIAYHFFRQPPPMRALASSETLQLP